MPCYEVKLMSVEFKAKNIEVLKDTLKSMHINFYERNGVLSWSSYSIDTNKQMVSCPQGYEDRINSIKMKYSEKILEQVALKKKWLFKKLQDNKFQMIKY